MKIRLLTIFALFLVATNMGWADTSTPIYVNGSSGNDDSNPGTDASPVKTIAKAITLVSEGGTIYLAAGEYTEDIKINKPLSLVGLGTNKPTKESTSSNDAYLTGKIQIIQAGSTTIKKVKMVRAADDSNSAHGNRTGLVEIPVGGIELTISDCCFINNKPGTDNGGATSNCCIYAYPEVTNCTLSINNSDFYLNDKYQRCFNDGSKGPVTFKMKNSNIIGSEENGKSSYNRPLAFYSKGASMEIVNSVISVQHGYGITFAEDEMKCIIDNSEIKGYAGLYIFNNNHDIQIKNNSIISGRTLYSGASDNFGAIVFEGSQGCNLSVTNSIITNEYGNDAKAYMWPILFSSNKDGSSLADKNKITLDHSRIRTTGQNTPYLIEYNSNADNQVIVKNNNIFSYNWNGLVSKGNTEALNSDKECIYALDKASVVGNAASDINSFLSNTKIDDIDQVIFPEGTFELPQTFSLDKSLTIEGAGKDKTTIKGHIEVNPKQGETATLTAKGLTLEGNNNSFGHGIIGITGNGTGKVGLTDCKISGGALKGQTAAVGVRMESVGAELTMKNTDIDVYYYGVSVRNINQKVTIDGGTIEGWAALMTSAGGLSTSDGSLANTNTQIKISNATLNAATISDEEYGAVVLQQKYNGVELTIDNSEITATDKRKGTYGKGVKMLSALDLRSFGNKIKVNGGTLSSSFGENTVRAAVISLGHNGDDTKSALADNTIIINSTLKGKEGELLVYSNRTGKAKECDKLTINGTDYSVSSGLICYGQPISSEVTLRQAITDAIDGETISVPTDITLTSPLVINKAITLTSSNKSAIKGHLVVEAEDVTVKDLKFECSSTGYLYNEKNAISVFANKVTLTGNEFTQASGIGANYVTNGIVFYPQGNGQEVTANYNVTGNVFKGIAKKAGTATSTSIIIRENFSDNSQLGDKATTATLKDFTADAAFVTQNKFESCEGGEYYVRSKGEKYVYASLYSETGNAGITEALKCTNEKSILFIANLKVEDLAALITSDLPKLAYIDCSDALVVTTKDKVASLPANNKPIALLKRGSGKADIEYITTLPTISNPNASGIDAGKTLSTSILSGGSAKVSEKAITGTFAWEHPDAIATTSTTSYNAVFTPSDLTRYGRVTVSVPVEVTQYWTVTAGVCNNGKITITNGNAGNRYKDGTDLTLEYTPDAHYKVSASAPKTVKATEDKVLTTTFEQIMHKVTVNTPTGGSLKVMNGDTEVSNGASIAEGTVLTVIAAPTTTGGNGNGFKLVNLTAGNNPISNNSVTVNKALTISASFEALPASEYTVGFADNIAHGKLTMMDANKNVVNAGASVIAGTKVTVIAIPDKGYELNGSITVSDSPVTNNIYQVTANTKFSASFTAKTYAVTTSISNGDIVIKNKETGTDVTSSLTQIAYGTVLTATATAKDSYKVSSIVVNGKEIPNGGEFTVTDATKVVVTTIEKAKISLINLKQTVTYDGTGKQFIVQSIPAGLSGFTVTYDGASSLPINAADNTKKEYKVTITRTADDTYEAVNVTNASLTIEAAELTGITAPTYNDSWAHTAGTCTATQVGGGPFDNVTVTPTDVNYKPAVFNLPKSTTDLTPVSLASAGLRSMSLRDTKPEATLSIEATHGGVSLWNGGEKLTAESKIYVGQKLTVKGEPDAGYSTLANWTINKVQQTSGETTTITLTNENSIKVEFFAKAAPKEEDRPKVTQQSSAYTGNPIQPTIDLKEGSIAWTIRVKKDGAIVEQPTDAGEYEVWAQCSEQEQYAAFDGQIGSYTINPQEISGINVTSATPILKGQNIGQSELTGNAPVEGTFSWKNPSLIAEGNGTTSKAYDVTFKPASSNYSVASTLNLTQTIPFYAATKVETRQVTFVEAANGTFIVKVNEAEVKSGAQITTGDKITIETSPNSNYTSTVSVTGATNTGGVYIVGDAGNVEVKVTFTKNSTPGGGEEPGVVSITGVVLDSSSKTLAVGEEFKLTASVKPAEADQSVTWSSSDETVATVKKGTVKALKAGKATITATASDDTHYAECEVTVSVATGIDELIASTRVLGCDGYIMIEPMATIETLVTDMMGRIFYHGRLTEKMQIPVSEGVYLVRLSNKEKTVTVKVIVR